MCCRIDSQLLRQLTSSKGVFDGSRQLGVEEGGICKTFASDYILGQALLLIAAIVVVVVNLLLKVRLSPSRYFVLLP